MKSYDLRITLKRGLAGVPKNQRATIRALGLKRIGHTVVKEDRPEIRGMVRKVQHLVCVEEVKSAGRKKAQSSHAAKKPSGESRVKD